MNHKLKKARKCTPVSEAFADLSEAYGMGKKEALAVIERVRAEFCSHDHFDSVVWNLSCAVLECVALENRVSEFDIHQLFRNNYSKIAAGRVVNVKSDPHNIPDAWVLLAGQHIPVEMKLHNFDRAAVDQLDRYIKFYNAPKGIAVGAALTATLPPNMEFISIHDLLEVSNTDSKQEAHHDRH